MATLFGVVMLTHQVGGFLGRWLGGKVFEAPGPTTGSGTSTSCWRSARRCLHLPIREAPLARVRPAAA
jgi:hypothetical protein